MLIHEIINEDFQTDEGVLGSIGRGVAAGIGGLAKGAGMVAGVGQGVKQAFQKGKATSTAHIAGDVPKQPKPVSGPGNPTYDAEYARLTGKQPVAATQTSQTAPGSGQQQTSGNVQQPAAAQTPAKPAAGSSAGPNSGSLEQIKKSYELLSPQERTKLKQDLDIIDDQDRLASGTNENKIYGKLLRRKN